MPSLHRLQSFAHLVAGYAIAALLAAAFGGSAPAFAQVQPVPPEATAPSTSTGPAASASEPKALTATDGKLADADNPYGLKAMLEHGDAVSKTVLGLLLIMSMGTWLIFFGKLNEQRRILKDAKSTNKTFWTAGSMSQGIKTLGKDSAFRFIAEAADGATKHHEGLLERVDLQSWLTMSLDEANEEVGERIEGGLSFLATVGSTAPFIGLFGTVWGILNALTAIGVAGQASIDKVAGPVGEALIMTAIGLAVAVPAVLGYNLLVRRNRQVMAQVRSFSSKLRPMVLSTVAG